MGSHFIDGHWQSGSGEPFESENPADGDILWHGRQATSGEVEAAVVAARAALADWRRRDWKERYRLIEAFGARLQEQRPALAETLARETGKPRWEADTEIGAMLGKLAISARAYEERTGERESASDGVSSRLRHRPHGVVAVFGPFNFPGHLPNGHIVPALLAGNTVVFKPSEQTPLVAEQTVRCWQEAGLPAGVLNLVQGARATGEALAGADIDGLFFTGSATVGHALHRRYADRPGRILALEMGGNNPLIVHRAADPEAAALLTIQSAFITAGQRCTCARRLIVPHGAEGDRFVEHLAARMADIRVDAWDADPPPFTGPVISTAAADSALAAWDRLRAAGGRDLLAPTRPRSGRPFITPGLMDVSEVTERPDAEIFAPLLQLIRVRDFDAALAEANRTVYGLAAGLLSDDPALFEAFDETIRAGIVNWNRPTTGAASSAPFGGIGASGNHRPSAYYAADYCAYPVATQAAPRLTRPELPGLGPGR